MHPPALKRSTKRASAERARPELLREVVVGSMGSALRRRCSGAGSSRRWWTCMAPSPAWGASSLLTRYAAPRPAPRLWKWCEVGRGPPAALAPSHMNSHGSRLGASLAGRLPQISVIRGALDLTSKSARVAMTSLDTVRGCSRCTSCWPVGPGTGHRLAAPPHSCRAHPAGDGRACLAMQVFMLSSDTVVRPSAPSQSSGRRRIPEIGGRADLCPPAGSLPRWQQSALAVHGSLLP